MCTQKYSNVHAILFVTYVLFKSNPSDNLVEFDIRGNLVEGNLLEKRFLSFCLMSPKDWGLIKF